MAILTETSCFVTHDRAVRGVDVLNDGREDLLVIKFFGPDINKPRDRAALTPRRDPRRATPSADGDTGACVEDVHRFRADAEGERLAHPRTFMRPQPDRDLRARPRERGQEFLPNAHLG